MQNVILRPEFYNFQDLFGLAPSVSFSALAENYRGMSMLNGGVAQLTATALTTFPRVEEQIFETTNDLANVQVTYNVMGEDPLNTVIRVIRGDHFTFRCQVQQDGVPSDISNWTFTMTAKWEYSDPDASAVFQRSTGNGITITNATNGELEIELIPVNTNGLPPNRTILNFDLQAVTPAPANRRFTVMYGKLVVEPDVTIA